MLLHNQWITEKIKEKIFKIPGDKRKWKQNDPKSMGCNKNSSKREVYNNTSLQKETRKISNQQPNLTPLGTRKRRINKTESE